MAANMTKDEILEGNAAIAKFMGLKLGWWISQQKPLTDDKKQWCDLDGKTFLGTRAYFNKDLLFHSSWDWQIPAWQKLNNSVDDITVKMDVVSRRICTLEFRDFTTQFEINIIMFPPIDSFEILVEAIKWYTQIKK